jgi:hypothetical protein
MWEIHLLSQAKRRAQDGSFARCRRTNDDDLVDLTCESGCKSMTVR